MTQQEAIPFRCKISTTDATVPLSMRVILNDEMIFENLHVTEDIAFECMVQDGEQEHVLTFEMSGKKSEHTTIDDQGNITKDACLIINDFDIDEISLNNTNLFTYTHDFNGSKGTVIDKFYSAMGCNGQVSIKFSTPLYLWLLEHL